VNTEYSLGKLCIRFESHASRRRFVVLLYSVLAAVEFASIYVHFHPRPSYLASWIDSGLAILFVALFIVFTWINDDWRRRGDERETHRREHAYTRSYRALTVFILAEFLAVSLSWGPSPTTPWPTAVRAFLMQLNFILAYTLFLLYITLPQAILLWTEPDMEADPEVATR
jgi:hypothetical protein